MTDKIDTSADAVQTHRAVLRAVATVRHRLSARQAAAVADVLEALAAERNALWAFVKGAEYPINRDWLREAGVAGARTAGEVAAEVARQVAADKKAMRNRAQKAEGALKLALPLMREDDWGADLGDSTERRDALRAAVAALYGELDA